MKIGLVIIISLIFSELAIAQVKYDANWVFGSNAWVDFNDTVNPIAQYKSCYNQEAIASISDSNGNLLFYITTLIATPYGSFSIVDSSGDLLGNGDSINAGTVTSDGAIIIPAPNRPFNYYLFHLGVMFDENGVYQLPMYTTIVYDSGIANYAVTKKNVILSEETVEQRMALVKHANGTDWWLFVHGNNSNTWYSFLITGEGILGPYYQQIGIQHVNGIGCMTFSPTGKYMADAIWEEDQVELFDFDRCTGLLYNCRSLYQVSPDSTTYGVEFSPNETKLYVTVSNTTIGNNMSELYQYTVTEDTSSMEKQLIWTSNNIPAFTGQLQLAPDNKIYIAVLDRRLCCPYPDTFFTKYNQYLWRINTPDSSGAKCNFQPFALYLGDSSRSYDGLPNMPNFNLGRLQTSVWQSTISNDTFICTNIDTPTKGVVISVDTIPGVTVTWQAAPGIDNINATRQLVNPTQSTWYYVTFTDTTIQGSCQNRTDSVYVEVRLCDTLGIQTLQVAKVGLTVIPNPMHNETIIRYQLDVNDVNNGTVQVTDIFGKQIALYQVNNSFGNIDFEMPGLASGIYFCTLRQGQKTLQVQKVAKF